MKQMLLAFVLMAVAAVGLARYFDRAVKSGGASSVNAMAMAAKPAPEPAPSDAYYRTVTLNSDRRGHFLTNARVDGRSIEFLVDTGASTVALRESSAARLGIHPS